MLVEFSVSNFRSIGPKITLSMMASASSAKRKSVAHPTGNSFAPSLLKSAVIFGPNAAGKSSIIQALDFMRAFISQPSTRSHSDPIVYPYNKLLANTDSISEFELVFLVGSDLYQFGFQINSQRVVNEWMYMRSANNRSRMRLIYSRSLVDNKIDEYEWKFNDPQIPGERESWRKSTRHNTLFLSTAVQLNSETLRIPFDWIKNNLHVVRANQRIRPNFTASLLDNKELYKPISNIIKALDLHISEFRVRYENFAISDSVHKILSPSFIKEMMERAKDEKEEKIYTVHKSVNQQDVEFEFDEESDGTQAILGLAGPIFDVIVGGETLVVDELSNSLHPFALRAIVQIFNDPRINHNGAQLIFSSHETSIISKNMMHKDQIWFVNREKGNPTELVSLSEFSVRDSEAFQRGYLGGKFGALPNIEDIRHAFED